MTIDLVVRGKRVVTPQGEKTAAIHVQRGVIAAVTPFDEVPASVPTLDAGELVVMPGIVDTHVHINEPGRTEWEGFDTATKAAAAGGITTLVDMPLNSVPATTKLWALDAKQYAGRDAHVEVVYWGGVVPGNEGDIEPLVDAGVPGFKCFLSPSSVDEF